MGSAALAVASNILKNIELVLLGAGPSELLAAASRVAKDSEGLEQQSGHSTHTWSCRPKKSMSR